MVLIIYMYQRTSIVTYVSVISVQNDLPRSVHTVLCIAKED
jgi:hypothetical protein